MDGEDPVGATQSKQNRRPALAWAGVLGLCVAAVVLVNVLFLWDNPLRRFPKQTRTPDLATLAELTHIEFPESTHLLRSTWYTAFGHHDVYAMMVMPSDDARAFSAALREQLNSLGDDGAAAALSGYTRPTWWDEDGVRAGESVLGAYERGSPSIRLLSVGRSSEGDILLLEWHAE